MDVGPEEETLSSKSVLLMGSAEVLPEFGDGNVEVECWVGVEETSNKVDEETVG